MFIFFPKVWLKTHNWRELGMLRDAAGHGTASTWSRGQQPPAAAARALLCVPPFGQKKHFLQKLLLWVLGNNVYSQIKV